MKTLFILMVLQNFGIMSFGRQRKKQRYLFNVTPEAHILDLQITKNFVLLLLKAPRLHATRLHLRLLDQRRSS